MAASAVSTGSGVTLSLRLSSGLASAGYDVWPGKSLRGNVTFIRTEPVTVRGLRVRLLGTVKSDFLTSERRHSQTRVLCDERVEILAHDKGMSYSPGQSDFDFKLTVPSELPPTFDGTSGWVRYTLEASVDIPFWPDLSSKMALVVAPGQSPPKAPPSTFVDTAIAPLSLFATCWPSTAVAVLGVAAPSRWLPVGAACFDCEAGVAVYTQSDLRRAATVSLVRRVTYLAGGSKVVEETTLGSTTVPSELAAEGLERGSPLPRPVRKRPVRLELRRAGPSYASFNAADTVRVDYRLVVSVHNPWAFLHTVASVPLWCRPPAQSENIEAAPA